MVVSVIGFILYAVKEKMRWYVVLENLRIVAQARNYRAMAENEILTHNKAKAERLVRPL
jgi:hypothetical protein